MTLPKNAVVISQTLKAQVITLPVGHNLMAEAPDGVLQAMRNALGC